MMGETVLILQRGIPRGVADHLKTSTTSTDVLCVRKNRNCQRLTESFQKDTGDNLKGLTLA